MQVQVKSSNGITLVPVESVLISKRRIFIEGEINEHMACDFVREIMLMTEEDEEKPIDVMLNTGGGEINSGMLIYDVIQSCDTPIRLFCMGKAYRMGALILAGGKNGRYIMPHGEIMIHEPMLENTVSGFGSSLKTISNSLDETRNQFNELLSRHTGKSVGEIEQFTCCDVYFTPEKSIEFGLCDKVVSFGQIMKGEF